MRQDRLFLSPLAKVFQSTHLVWGATIECLLLAFIFAISIHAPRVRCDAGLQPCFNLISYFNPRTSCEVRLYTSFLLKFWIVFQSTHLVWGATCVLTRRGNIRNISIHAPRVRCDPQQYCNITSRYHFNPRTSCEVRLVRRDVPVLDLAFQSTHLVWGATLIFGIIIFFSPISIHAPRVRCDKLVIVTS